MVRVSGSGGASNPTAPHLTSNPFSGVIAGGAAGGSYTYEKTHQVILNPPFDPRMHAIGNPALNPDKIKRGWMEYAPVQVRSQGVNYRVNFLFNPEMLEVGGDVTDRISTGEATQKSNLVPQGVRAVLSSSLQNVSLGLVYDRTYELTGYSHDRTWASFIGVYADVAAWYHYLGAFGDDYALGEQINDVLYRPANPTIAEDWRQSMIWKKLHLAAPMQYRLSYLFIGDKLRYYGWISSFNVTYTHWNSHMAPQRCKINISFSLGSDEKWLSKHKQNKGGGDVSWQDTAEALNPFYNPYISPSPLGNTVNPHLPYPTE